MDADPLLHRPAPLAGVVDHRGRPVSGPDSGGWTAALFIIGVEIAERFAYYGASLNLITYLMGPLGESTATAAAAVNAWSGVAYMLPLVGAFVADSYLGRYRTILVASLLYVLALSMLTLSSVLSSLRLPEYKEDLMACLPLEFQVTFFYISLYLMAFAQGGHKPCVQAFGADQFDQNDPKELESRRSFFNWWYFGMCGGTMVANLILTYIQDNIGWSLGFGIPCIAMTIALIVFLLGTKTYRFYLLEDKSPFTRIGKGFVHLASTHHPMTSGEEEEAMGVLRLFPIWVTSLMYGVVCAQTSTFFTKQGGMMDRRIGPRIQVPPAALQSIIYATIFVLLPVYDCVLVPLARKFTNKSSGITMLQRIGIGMVLSLMCIMVAALVEMKRLQITRDLGLVDLPMEVIPMSLWWLVPQYTLYGISEVFAMVGLQEFFYDQMPDSLRSIGLALYLSIFGIGGFISSILVSLIEKVTSGMGGSWFNNNLNLGHLDYYYWILTALSAAELVLFFHFAQAYVYRKKGNDQVHRSGGPA